MKKTAVLLLSMIMLCLCLVGCGGSDVEGKWETTKVTEGGKSYEGEYNGIPIAVVYQVEFKSGGKGTITAFSVSAEDDDHDFTWEADGKTIKLTAGEGDEKDTMEMTLDGDKLSGSFGGVSVEMKKVDKFTEFDFEEFKKKLLSGDDE